ncbi:type III secretion system inner rod subunit SctI [Pandoraea sp. PE-S2R-1]|uniref:type III secretion system inner rod subunit SctI n=1 Tax=Pandoraea sp. PE-S2R-1 TaxID=1986994 RepID=UPI000B401B25|nr:type III secretion system inner rod subunit SctI [Pandoraea sp. PE-S2R-1]
MSIAPVALSPALRLTAPPAHSAHSVTDASVSVIANQPDATDSLESRFIRAAADMSARFEADRAQIADDVIRIDPTDLVAMNAMQVRLAQYSLDVSMTSTLARKVVGAVEALLR